MPARIEDYALIGDLHTTALVSRRGSVDWLCWPRFDSGACFAALLGTPANGRWRIAPKGGRSRTRRRYRQDTLILETEFEHDEGTALLIDFMPLHTHVSHLIRLAVGLEGRVPMTMELILRFDYGSSVPWVTRLPEGGGIRAIAGPEMVVLHTPAPLVGRDLKTLSEFTLARGDRLPFVLTHAESYDPRDPRAIDPLCAIDAEQALAETEKFWRRWVENCTLGGTWAEPVRRSLITLKALTYRPTGGIVAAPTTSLPEQLGGVRNWDYRYCWLRDATMTLLALMDAGYYDEARDWRGWLQRAIAGSPEQVQIMYGLAGERRLPEWEIPWLGGYRASRPVRIGNAAAGQLQLDVFGEVMDALHQARKGGIDSDPMSWSVQRAMIRHLEKIWGEADEGIWETRGPRQHFTFSKVMAWVAIDRAIKGIELFDLPGPLRHWQRLRTRIHDDVCRRGFNAKLGAFVQSYGGKELDASLLLLPLTGFLPADDPRSRGTVAAIERELMADGLVWRYKTAKSDDGLPPGEGTFLVCSFWLADNMILQDREEEAGALFERLLALRNDVGLLSEEYDPHAKRMLGNFPQAFSHIGLINTALNLARLAKPDERGDRQSSIAHPAREPGKAGNAGEREGRDGKTAKRRGKPKSVAARSGR